MEQHQRTIDIQGVNPTEFFGQKNANISTIGRYFPKLKIVARGEQLTAIGEDEVLDQFESKIAQIVSYLERYNSLTTHVIEQIIENNGHPASKSKDNVILHGASGQPIKAQSPNQQLIVDRIEDHDMLFAVGPAGTGKTYTAVAMAVKALKEKKVKRIVLTRPAVEAGENLGFLPGDLKEKLDPYLQPLYDALRDMIPNERLGALMEKGVIQIAPLAFMRGRTLDSAFVILDEAQNTTAMQMKMFLTRMGRSAKFIITGDPGQVDLPPKQKSGLKEAIDILNGVRGIEFVYLDEKDVIRHPLVKEIIKAYDRQAKT